MITHKMTFCLPSLLALPRDGSWIPTGDRGQREIGNRATDRHSEGNMTEFFADEKEVGGSQLIYVRLT